MKKKTAKKKVPKKKAKRLSKKDKMRQRASQLRGDLTGQPSQEQHRQAIVADALDEMSEFV